MFTLHALYVGAALLGGLLLVAQIAMSVLGIGGDGDMDAGGAADAADAADADASFAGFSFRTVVAFVTFFGLGGWAGLDSGLGDWTSVGIGVLSGSLAFWIVGLILSQTHRLSSSGTVDIKNAVGQEARVYLLVPPERTSAGAVTVKIQGRSMQYKAITRGRELKTGALCKVVAVASSDTLEVESL
ncbi:MAG: hypothetical protein JNN27_12970 [Planctomycetes bacterium]|nr:hypothetical protein [Planctomycetota bacterium]